MAKSLELVICSGSNPADVLEVLQNRIEPKFLDELKGAGGGSFKIWYDDEKILETPSLLDERNLVRCRIDGVFTHSFIIKNKKATTVSTNEKSGEGWEISGDGPRSWFGDARVYPRTPLRPSAGDTRYFNFATEQGSWYKPAQWVNATVVKQQDDTSVTNRWRGRPAEWPDVPDAKWIWDRNSAAIAPLGDVYFRHEFNLTEKTQLAFFLGVDDLFQFYVDGELLAESDPDQLSYATTTRVDFTLDAGWHILAVRARNTGGSGPAGFIGVLKGFGDPLAPTPAYVISKTGQTGFWKVLGYPATVPGWTPGEVMNKLLDEAKARGVRFPDLLTRTFTNTTDSSGAAWPREVEWAFSVGQDYNSVIEKMEELGYDIWVDQGNLTLNMSTRRGTDRSTGDAPVELRVGYNLLSAGEESQADIANTLLMQTSDGWEERFAPGPESLTKYGRVEGTLSTDVGSAVSSSIADLTFKQKALPETAATFVVIETEDVVPLRDYFVGDTLRAPDAKKVPAPRKVYSISVTENMETGAVEYAVEFDGVFQDKVDKLEQQINRLNKGVAGSGGANTSPITPSVIGGPPPITDITRTPKSPLTLSGTAEGYWLPDGSTRTRANLSWAEVSEDIYGAAIVMDSYEVWGRPQSTTTWRRFTVTSVLTAQINDFTTNSTWTFRVRGVSLAGRESGWSPEVNITMLAPTTNLLAPSKPTMASKLGTATASWDGLLGTSTPPESFDYVQARVSTTETGTYTPFGANLRAAGSVTLSDVPVGEVRWVRFYAFNRLGIASNGSIAASVLITGVDVGDLDGDVNQAIEDAYQHADDALNLANTKNKTYTQPAAPTVDLVAGDLWYDSDDGNKPYRWSGTDWIAVQDATIATAQTTANSKNKVYAGTAPTAPAGGFVIGDTWFDSTAGNAPKRWDGTQWVLVRDTTIATAQTAATNAATAATAAQASANTALAQSPELVPNGSFELGTTAAPTNWTLSTNATISTSAPRTGLRHLNLAAATGVNAYTGLIDVVPGSRLRMSAWGRGAGANTYRATLRVVDTALADVGTNLFFTLPFVANVWNRAFLDFTVPAGVTQIRLQVIRSNSSGVGIVDDVSLLDITEAYNTQIIANDAATAAAAASTAASGAQTTADGKGQVYYSTTAPVVPRAQDLWIDTSGSPAINMPKRWNGTAWVSVTDKIATDAAALAGTANTTANTALTSANGKNKTYITSGAPTAPAGGFVAGDLWFDTDNGNRPSRWSGSAWVLAQDTAISTAQNTADAKGQTYFQTTAPSPARTQDLWIDTTGGANTPKRYDGSVWQSVTDKIASDAAALASTANTTANTALTSANGKTKTYFNSGAPTAPAGGFVEGDLWFDSSAGNKSYRWTGSAWVSVVDAAIGTAQTTAEGKGQTYFQTTAPTPARAQDLWVDTTGGANTPKRWNGTAWVSVTDKIASDAASLASTANSTANTALTSANGKNKTYINSGEPTAPAGGFVAGDLWYDTANGNRINRWSGSAWVSVVDAAIGTAQTTADGKGQVFYTTTAPSPARTQDLWIDTTGGANTPKRYNGTAWVSVTDKVASDAAAAALAAQGTANGAVTAANGKNKLIWSTAAASGTTGYVAGDVWYRRDSSTVPQVIGMWEYTGSAWASRTLTDSVVSNLSAATITTGVLSADRIAAASISVTKLVMSDFTNLAEEPNFDSSGAGWNYSNVAAGSYVVMSTTQGMATRLTRNATQDNLVYNNNLLPVNAGDEYYLSGQLNNNIAGTPGIQFGLVVWNGATPTRLQVGSRTASGWGSYSGSVVIPSGATRAQVYAVQPMGAAGNVSYFCNVVLRRKSGAELIVDGAITTDKLSANAVTAAKIAAGTITANEIAGNTITAAKIATGTLTSASGIFGTIDASILTAGTINADRIAASSISTSKLLVSNLTNMIEDPSFELPFTTNANAAWTKSTFALLSVSARTGATAGLLGTAAANYEAFRQVAAIQVEAGEKYLFGAWVRTVADVGNVGGVELNVAYGSASTASTLTSPGIAQSPAGLGTTYVYISGSWTVPNNTKFMRPRVVMRDGGSGISYLMDDMVVYKQVSAELIVDGAITTDKLTANAVTAAKIATGTITANEIAGKTITADQIAAGTITSASGVFGSVDAAVLTTGFLNADRIGASSIVADKIASGAITTDKLDANAVTAAKIAAGTITAVEIAGQTITADQIAAGTITSASGVFGSVDAAVLTTGVLNADRIGATSITTEKLAADAVTADKIASKTITADEIATGTLTSASGVFGAIDAGSITTGILSALLIGAESITGDKIAGTTITGDKIVGTTITGDKIAGQTITATNIAGNTITAAQILGGTITATEIAGTTITGDKLVGGTITATQLASNSVTAIKIAAGVITSDKLVIGDFTNFVDDPGFEVSTLPGWSNTGSVSTTTSVFRSGTRAAIFGTGTKALTGLNVIPVKPGDQFYASAWYRHSATPAGTLGGLRLINQSGTAVATVNFVASVGAWAQAQLAYTVPAGVTTLRVYLQTATTTGSTYVDDIEFRRKSGGELIVDGAITARNISAQSITTDKLVISDFTNLVDNPSFERDMLGWTTMMGTVTTQTGVIRGGTRAAQLSANSQLLSLFQLQVTEGSQFNLSAWYRHATTPTPGSGGLGGLRLITDQGNDVAGFTSTLTASVGGWSQTTIAGTIPAGVSLVQIYFYNNSNAVLYLDDVEFRRRNGAELIVDGAITATKIGAGAITTEKINLGAKIHTGEENQRIPAEMADVDYWTAVQSGVIPLTVGSSFPSLGSTPTPTGMQLVPTSGSVARQQVTARLPVPLSRKVYTKYTGSAAVVLVTNLARNPSVENVAPYRDIIVTRYQDWTSSSLVQSNRALNSSFNDFIRSGVYFRNVIANSGFDINAAFWGQGLSPGTVTITRDTSWSASGSASGRLTASGTNIDTSMTYKPTDALPDGLGEGDWYITATIRLTAAQTGSLDSRARRIVVYYTNSAGTTVSAGTSAQAPNAAGVTVLSLQISIPAGVTDVSIRLYNGSATSTVWWDRIMAVQSSVAVPFIGDQTSPSPSGADANGDPLYPDLYYFQETENGTTYISMRADAPALVAGSTPQQIFQRNIVGINGGLAVISREWAYQGVRSLRITGTIPSGATNAGAKITQVIDGAAGDQFHVGAWVRWDGWFTGAGANARRIVVIFGNRSSTGQGFTEVGYATLPGYPTAVTGSGSYEARSDITIPAGATAFYLAAFQAAGSTDPDLWIDLTFIGEAGYTGPLFDANTPSYPGLNSDYTLAKSKPFIGDPYSGLFRARSRGWHASSGSTPVYGSALSAGLQYGRITGKGRPSSGAANEFDPLGSAFMVQWATATAISAAEGVGYDNVLKADVQVLQQFDIKNVTTYTFAMYVYVSKTQRLAGRVGIYDTGPNPEMAVTVGAAVVVPANTWTRIPVTLTTSGVSSYNTYRVVMNVNPVAGTSASAWAPGDVMYADAVTITETAAIEPFFDGSNGLGQWTGLPNASISQKNSGGLQILAHTPTGDFISQPLTDNQVYALPETATHYTGFIVQEFRGGTTTIAKAKIFEVIGAESGLAAVEITPAGMRVTRDNGTLAVTVDSSGLRGYNPNEESTFFVDPLTGNTSIVGGTFSTSSAVARTELSPVGLQTFNEDGVVTARFGHDIDTAVSVLDPASGQLVPLAQQVFGTFAYSNNSPVTVTGVSATNGVWGQWNETASLGTFSTRTGRALMQSYMAIPGTTTNWIYDVKVRLRGPGGAIEFESTNVNWKDVPGTGGRSYMYSANLIPGRAYQVSWIWRAYRESGVTGVPAIGGRTLIVYPI